MQIKRENRTIKLFQTTTCFLRRYIAYSREFDPVLSPGAKTVLKQYYVQMAVTQLDGSITPRALETLFRLAIAKCRSEIEKYC